MGFLSVKECLKQFLGIDDSKVIKLRDIKIAKEMKDLLSFLSLKVGKEGTAKEYAEALKLYRKNKIKNRMKGKESWI